MEKTQKSTGKTSSSRRAKQSSRGKSKAAPTENAPPLPAAPLSVPVPKPVQSRSSKHTTISRIFSDTPLMVAFRHIRPSWKNYIEYVDLAARNGDEDMGRYVKCWLALGAKERNAHAPEQLCELANVKPDELVGAVCSSIWRAKSAEGSLVSAMAHPKILERTARAADKTAGFKDRELFFRVTGQMPDKQGGTSVIINNNNTPKTLVANGAGGSSSSFGQGSRQSHGLLSMDDEAIDMSRLLEAPAGENVLFVPQAEAAEPEEVEVEV